MKNQNNQGGRGRVALGLAGLGLVLGGCTTTGMSDPVFSQWLAQAEAYCVPLYGALPLATAEQRTQFEALSYQTYYRNVLVEVYADRLQILYPDNRLTIDCLANAFPGQ